MWRNWNPYELLCIAGGNIKACSYLEKVSWFLKKFNTELPYDPTVPLICMKPCTSDWDLNPRARTQTWPKPTVFQLRSHTWFQDLMKLRFLMSHRRKNSVRNKVIRKKWIYLERNTIHRQIVGHLRRWERHQGMGFSVFRGVDNLIGWWVGGVFQLFQEGAGISRNWATTHFWILMVILELSWSLWVCYLACCCVTMSVYWGSRSSGSWLVHHLGPILF